MNQISTISEFLLQAGTEYRVFDMGRSIRKLSTQVFLEYENGVKKPAFPRAQHAWFGLLFWNKTLSSQHYIWFIKLPLDEQGQIMPAARNHFLQLIVDALGKQLEHAESKNGQLPENPYSFIPNQQQLADFNSVSRRFLKLGYSDYYQVALAYFKQSGVMQWQQVPLQGLSDLVANIDDQDVRQLVTERFSALVEPVKYSVLISMENQKVPISLAEEISIWLKDHPDNPVYWQNGLRALCQSPCQGLVAQLLEQTFNTELANNGDLLMVVAGRLWPYLGKPELLRKFFEAVSQLDMANPDQDMTLFAPIYRDLVQIPDLRDPLHQMLRWSDKSPALTQAVGKLFSGQM